MISISLHHQVMKLNIISIMAQTKKHLKFISLSINIFKLFLIQTFQLNLKSLYYRINRIQNQVRNKYLINQVIKLILKKIKKFLKWHYLRFKNLKGNKRRKIFIKIKFLGMKRERLKWINRYRLKIYWIHNQILILANSSF